MTKISYYAGTPILALILVVGLAGCHSNQPQSNTSAQDQGNANQSDPAAANLAPANESAAPPAGNSQSYAPAQNSYPSNTASTAAPQNQPAAYQDQAPPPDQGQYEDQGQEEPTEYAPEPPPPLPDYTQPECPGDNYIWTPGYWNYAPAGYYWVPGVWIMAPFVGGLWTPGYWGWNSNRYWWHRGYWGPHIGFYGGVNYGHGYTGQGYEGGYWNGGSFYYNRAITRVNTNVVRNVYDRNVRINNSNRVSYNGGRGGLNARATRSDLAAGRERHMGQLPAQTQHVNQARTNRAQFASVNHGRPATLAASRPITGRMAATPPAMRRDMRPSETRPGTTRPTAARPLTTQQRTNQARPANNTAHPATENRGNASPRVQPRTPNTPSRVVPATRPETRPASHPARPAQQARPQQQARPAPRATPPAQRAAPQPQRTEPRARPQAQARPQPQRAAPRAQPQAQPKRESRPESHPPANKQDHPH